MHIHEIKYVKLNTKEEVLYKNVNPNNERNLWLILVKWVPGLTPARRCSMSHHVLKLYVLKLFFTVTSYIWH